MYDEDEQQNVFRQKRLLKLLRQSGKVGDVVRDKGRLALPPGKRISKTGKIYWESRRSRSDALNSRT